MAVPQTREEFKQFCLRKLGRPVIKIEVDDDQVEDRIDEALRYYWDYHFDGTDKIYYKYQLTQDDINNKYIPVPENVIGVVNIFDMGDALGMNNLFNIRYQIALNDLYTLTSVSMVPFYMTMSHIAFLEQLLVGRQPIRYNRNINRLYVDMDWNKVTVGSYLVAEAYEIVDPTVYPDVWKDRWLARYTQCLIKQQWGQNTKKYDGMQMPGGIKFNGQKIFDEATEERKELEKEMIYSYSLPVTDMIGNWLVGILSLSLVYELVQNIPTGLQLLT
jgi:hypothetical protein